MIFGIILAIIILIIVGIIAIYNTLITLRNRVNNALSQIDVQLQRRFDLIPNLVESVKGYMTHERETLEKVTALRSSWANAKSVDDKVDLDNQLSDTLKTIMAISENYPDLKANENFISLQNDLKDTETKIAYSRQFYNDTVTKYNTKIEMFPTNMVAGIFGFKSFTLFEVDSADARKSVKVTFDDNVKK